MTDLTPLQRWKRIVTKVFPWIARIGLAPSGALQIKSTANRTEIEGGGPAALRVGDVAWLILDPGVPPTLPPVLYYSTTSAVGPWLPLALVSIPGGPPVPLIDVGTQLAPSGSKKVTVG